MPDGTRHERDVAIIKAGGALAYARAQQQET